MKVYISFHLFGPFKISVYNLENGCQINIPEVKMLLLADTRLTAHLILGNGEVCLYHPISPLQKSKSYDHFIAYTTPETYAGRLLLL